MSSEEQRGARGPQGDRKREGGVAWEYTTCDRLGDMSMLNLYGSEGWELVAVVKSVSYERHIAYLKRPTAAQPARRK